MSVKLGLAGDTMLGRGVAEELSRRPGASLFDDGVVDVAREADLFVLNLECCISDRGERWRSPGKPFFFRAPPQAAAVLEQLEVDCVSLANNHALDYGYDALLDTFDHLRAAGVDWVGAGPNLERARSPRVFDVHGTRVATIAVADHPSDFEAADDRPGIAYADLRSNVPPWLTQVLRQEADIVIVMPHWGPNMTPEPLDYVRDAAEVLMAAGAGLVAGHSAHVFHGVRAPILYDLGDFIDDYAVDPVLRNDLGLLFLVTIDDGRPSTIEAIPLRLDYCRTTLATGDDHDWIRRRFIDACARLGTEATYEDGRLIVTTQPFRAADRG